MITVVYTIILALVLVAIYFGIRFFVSSRRRFGGGRMIVCPETAKEAMVEVNTRHAALSSLLGQTDLRLENCWRWPLKQDCGQECLLQLDVAPPECLVRSVLEKWYRGKQCVYCQHPFEDINIISHKPALLNPEGVTVEWGQIPLTAATEAMNTYLPVCWDCHIAHEFHLQHPDLVVERPPIARPPHDYPAVR
jgi:hypothetical protein